MISEKKQSKFRRLASVISGILLVCNSNLHAVEDADEITYELLAEESFTDHVIAFRKLFEIQEVHSFLEFGLGLGTKFFLENCNHVTSIELLVKDRHAYVVPWYCDCLGLFKKYSNWTPSLQIFSNVVNHANELAIKSVDPERYSSAYLKEINQFLDRLFKNNHYDVVFVDPGMHVRGDIVNCLFGRADIIAAHDTNFNSIRYGWYKVQTPENYEKIKSSHGSGITFWIVKEKQVLIDELKNALGIL